jgi:hypothetical protein
VNPRRARLAPGARLGAAQLTATLLAAALLTGCVAFPFLPQPVQPTVPDVQDFVFASFDATYQLDRDENGVATLTTTEHLVALFPEYDQNRGIARVLIDRVGDQETGLTVVAVTDGAGDPIDFDVTDDDGPAVSVVMAGEDFVHGRQEYVLTYMQRNVVIDDRGVELFHWGVNGTGWQQPFGEVTARVELSDSIAEGVETTSACYVESMGASPACDLVRDGNVLIAGVVNVEPGQSLTLRLEFAPDVFEVD